MPTFTKKPVFVEAHLWHENGDHPDDGPADQEGRIVRRYRTPDRLRHCGVCGVGLHDHGWIDSDGRATKRLVCPGDWVITNSIGECYAYDPDKFDAAYDRVPENA